MYIFAQATSILSGAWVEERRLEAALSFCGVLDSRVRTRSGSDGIRWPVDLIFDRVAAARRSDTTDSREF